MSSLHFIGHQLPSIYQQLFLVLIVSPLFLILNDEEWGDTQIDESLMIIDDHSLLVYSLILFSQGGDLLVETLPLGGVGLAVTLD